MKKKNKKKRIILSIIPILILLVLVIVVITFVNTKRLTCKSSEGNIVIFYNEKKIINATVTGNLSFDTKTQNSFASKIGVDEYISRFKTWFDESTDGSCK